MNDFEHQPGGQSFESESVQKNLILLVEAFEQKNETIPETTRKYLLSGPSQYIEFFLSQSREIREAAYDLIQKRHELYANDFQLMDEDYEAYSSKSFHDSLTAFDKNFRGRVSRRADQQVSPEYLFHHILNGSTPHDQEIITDLNAQLTIVDADKKEEIIHPNQEVINFTNKAWVELQKKEKLN